KSSTTSTTAATSTTASTTDSTAAPSTSTGTETSQSATPQTDPPPAYDQSASLHATYYIAPTHLDPHNETNGGLRVFWRPAYDTLFENYSGGTHPGVALSVDRSDDGLTVTLNLRDDVLFADGTPLESDAVVGSLERVRAEGAPVITATLKAVTEIAAVDAHTVEIQLSEPLPQLEALLGGPAGAIISPAGLAAPDQLATQTFGSGPFQSSDFVPDDHVTYTRSDVDYWDPAAGLYSELTITFVSELQTNLNGLQSGDFDIPFAVGGGDQLQRVADANGFVVYDYSSGGVNTYFLRTTRSGLIDQRVRQALNYAIDREGVAIGIFPGGDCVATSQNFPVGHPMHLAEEPYPLDTDKAKELIAEAGAEGMQLELIDGGNSGQHLIGLALQQIWNDLGLDVTVTTNPSGAAAAFGEGG
ncbi:MAG TPA: ABC transporter substrate-binding protein, partial [Ilumatobacteraceae bacterium]|nr:ABC transporter substrate-binding protein [Ilumatobacteraceae bacterium]